MTSFLVAGTRDKQKVTASQDDRAKVRWRWKQHSDSIQTEECRIHPAFKMVKTLEVLIFNYQITQLPKFS
jgi:hypothetical protein